MRRMFGVLCMVAAIWWLGVQAQAHQDVVPVDAGGPYPLERILGDIPQHGAAITLLPSGTVLFLDGAPVQLFQPLSSAQLRRVWVFSVRRDLPAMLGVTPVAEPISNRVRIRSINPFF